MEPLLWPPDGAPAEGDGYYEAIEAWARAKLGVEWGTGRPPFLYEEEVPGMR
jgi:hypothetical protein